MTTNDNEFIQPERLRTPSDAHGMAALLLVESLIHGLCENDSLSAGEAVKITERAVDVQFDQAEVSEGDGRLLWQSHALLSSIAASLRVELMGDGGSGPPRLVT